MTRHLYSGWGYTAIFTTIDQPTLPIIDPIFKMNNYERVYVHPNGIHLPLIYHIIYDHIMSSSFIRSLIHRFQVDRERMEELPGDIANIILVIICIIHLSSLSAIISYCPSLCDRTKR
jgi:hypothetical protein